MKEGKNFKILGVRQSLIGDSIFALPVLHWLELKYPNSYKYWHLAKKCAQAAPLFLNNPLIDKIVITDCEEGFGPEDLKLAESCDAVINTTPPHPFGENWHNQRTMAEETFIQTSLPIQYYNNLPDDQKYPKLYKWFNTEKREKTIAIHCFAGYGFDNHRSPSEKWWKDLISKLILSGYRIIRLGHTREPSFYADEISERDYQDLRHLSFIEQIQISLGCSIYIGTDSGFSLAMGAYGHPQCSLITNWNHGHTENPLCLQPLNKNNISLFNEFKNGGCSGINQDLVLEKIKLLI